MFLEVEKEFKRRLPVTCLFEAGTVAEMAVLIEGGEVPGSMVAIQPEGTHPPFFCVQPGRRSLMGLYHLAKHLGPDQPFYGIQSLGWDGEVVPFTKSTEMAAHYVAEMRKIQPHGPYYLGGGRIAVYMANILKEAGEEVALLAILGSHSLVGRKYVSIGQWLDRIGAPPGSGRIGLVRRYVRDRIHLAHVELYDRALRSVLFPVYAFYRATGKSVPPLLCRPDACNRLMRIEHRHMPTYEGDAVYFRAEIDDHSMSHVDLHDSWNRIIKGRLDTIPLTATADQIMNEPHVQLLAEKLALELARARKK